MMKILAIIQARGGSKGIPRKNIKELAGKPLIAWTIEAAKSAKHDMRVIVNTDDQEIADVAKRYGAEVPFMRPAELATDDAKSLPLIQHTLRWFAENENYHPDIVVQLKPTNPLRTSATIVKAIDLFLSKPDVDSVISVHETHDHPFKIWKIDESGFMHPFLPESFTGNKDAGRASRQSLTPAYRHNSAVNVIASKTLLQKNSIQGEVILPLIIDEQEALNIDTMMDFKIAELMMKERQLR